MFLHSLPELTLAINRCMPLVLSCSDRLANDATNGVTNGATLPDRWNIFSRDSFTKSVYWWISEISPHHQKVQDGWNALTAPEYSDGQIYKGAKTLDRSQLIRTNLEAFSASKQDSPRSIIAKNLRHEFMLNLFSENHIYFPTGLYQNLLLYFISISGTRRSHYHWNISGWK